MGGQRFVALLEGEVEPAAASVVIDAGGGCGLMESRPRPLAARDWVEEVDQEREIWRLTAAEREVLVESRRVWPERYFDVQAWWESTDVMQEALGDGVSGDGPDSAFWARMKERLNDRALVMLRPAHVLKGVGDDSWRSFAAAEAALLNGRSHPTVPVMDYILGETAKAWLEQQYGRLSEGDDGRPCLSGW